MGFALGLLIVVVICIFWYWYMMWNFPSMLCIPYDKFKFKTGDIILFHAYDNLNPMFIGSFWGHIGVVYDNPDTDEPPMLFEAVRTSRMKHYLQDNTSGIAITDLRTRLNNYMGIVACKSLNKPVDHAVIRGFVELILYAKKNMKYNENVIQNAINKKKGESINRELNCGEMAMISLVKLALLPESILEKNIAHHLLYMAQLSSVNDNYYHKPIELLFDPFT